MNEERTTTSQQNSNLFSFNNLLSELGKAGNADIIEEVQADQQYIEDKSLDLKTKPKMKAKKKKKEMMDETPDLTAELASMVHTSTLNVENCKEGEINDEQKNKYLHEEKKVKVDRLGFVNYDQADQLGGKESRCSHTQSKQSKLAQLNTQVPGLPQGMVIMTPGYKAAPQMQQLYGLQSVSISQVNDLLEPGRKNDDDNKQSLNENHEQGSFKSEQNGKDNQNQSISNHRIQHEQDDVEENKQTEKENEQQEDEENIRQKPVGDIRPLSSRRSKANEETKQLEHKQNDILGLDSRGIELYDPKTESLRQTIARNARERWNAQRARQEQNREQVPQNPRSEEVKSQRVAFQISGFSKNDFKALILTTYQSYYRGCRQKWSSEEYQNVVDQLKLGDQYSQYLREDNGQNSITIQQCPTLDMGNRPDTYNPRNKDTDQVALIPKSKYPEKIVVRYLDGSANFKVKSLENKYRRSTFEQAGISYQEILSTLLKLSQVQAPYRGRLKSYKKHISILLVAYFLVLLGLAIFLSVQVHWSISIGFIIFFFATTFIALNYLRKKFNKFLRQSHFAVAVVCRAENNRIYLNRGCVVRPGFLGKWVEFSLIDPEKYLRHYSTDSIVFQSDLQLVESIRSSSRKILLQKDESEERGKAGVYSRS